MKVYPSAHETSAVVRPTSDEVQAEPVVLRRRLGLFAGLLSETPRSTFADSVTVTLIVVPCATQNVGKWHDTE